jgi:hypothetical protein
LLMVLGQVLGRVTKRRPHRGEGVASDFYRVCHMHFYNPAFGTRHMLRVYA